MNCPQCNAWSNVKETRKNSGGKYRRYECANLHRFTTQEVVVVPAVGHLSTLVQTNRRGPTHADLMAALGPCGK